MPQQNKRNRRLYDRKHQLPLAEPSSPASRAFCLRFRTTGCRGMACIFFIHISRSKQDNCKKTDNRGRRDIQHIQNNRKSRFPSNLIHPANSSSNAISQHPVNQRTLQTLLRTAHYGANTPFRTVLNKSHIILYITGFQNRQEYRKSRDNSRNQYPVTYGSCANLYHPVYKRTYRHLKRPVNNSARQFTANPASHGSSNL